MFRNLLVPLDGSAFGEHALPLAITIARRAGATLQLLHVHRPLSTIYLEGGWPIDDSLETSLRQQAEDYLNRTAERVRNGSRLDVTTTLVEGEVAPSIEAAAFKSAADLVVLTTHGRGRLGRFWLGSVADDLVRHLPVPTLLVRPGEGGADLGREVVLEHVLLPLDGSGLAEQILGPGIDLTTLMGGDLTLLRVIHPVFPMQGSFGGTPLQVRVEALIGQIEEAQEALRQEALRYLTCVAERIRTPKMPVQTKVVAELQPAAAILHEVAVGRADVVALETHGRRGLSRLFLGSVADKVIRAASLPVLVQRPA
jgi:nucleotide-binding universal stress UspA family protein